MALTVARFADWMLLPHLRGRILAHAPAFVFDSELNRLSWANAAGAELLGCRDIVASLQSQGDLQTGFLRQLAGAARQIKGAESLVRNFRVFRDGNADYARLELRGFAVQGGGHAILATGLDECGRPAIPEHCRAAALIEACAEPGLCAAFIDEYGLVIAASPDLAGLTIGDEDFAALAVLSTESGGETVNRSLQIGGEGSVTAMVAQVAEQPERFLVLLAPVAAGNPDVERHACSTPDNDETALYAPHVSATRPSLAPPINDQSRRDRWYLGQADSEAARILPAPRYASTSRAADPDSRTVSNAPSRRQKLRAEGRADEGIRSRLGAGEGAFSFRGPGDPVRFTWSVDAACIFRFVSEELAATIGPNAADVVGRNWRDVANVFGFDRAGDILGLLKKRTTWSGKSVLWPVQGTDLAAPVDLAALPILGASRQFEGFRGFGIIRTADTINDPDKIGLALMPGPFGKVRPDAGLAQPGEDAAATPASATPHHLEGDAFPARTGADNGANIVELSSRKRNDATNAEALEEKLSGSEAQAFRQIGIRLDPNGQPTLPGAAVRTFALERGSGEDQAVQDASAAIDLPAIQPPAEAAALDKLDIPVLVFREGGALYANSSLLAATGHDSVTEIDAAGGLEALTAGGTSENGAEPTMFLIGKDGSRSAVSPVLQSVPWSDGMALRLAFHPSLRASDPVDDEQRARIAEMESILDTATDGIAVADRNGLVESLNASAQALFGVKFDRAQNLHLREFFAPESRKTIDDYISEIAQPGVASLLNDGREVIGRETNGGLIPLFITFGRIGETEKFCAVLRDITQWKKAEEELIGAKRAAETASEQKTGFLARVSHEIRTPLNAIIGFSEVMIEERFGPIDNERYREYLRDINRSGVHVLDLINDLLDISKIEAGKLELSYEAVDLNQIVSETVALLQPQANGQRIIIRTSLSRAVPRVVADARSIRQIILNLVSNAIKFTPMNGQVIVSTVYEGNGEVVLRVRDTGRGMTQGDIEHAMKPFHQITLDNDKRGSGTGLGLPLTKALVEANRAYFDLESTPGKGTIAHVHFPTQRVLAG
jgi:PAS domain S-box-containing protein